MSHPRQRKIAQLGSSMANYWLMLSACLTLYLAVIGVTTLAPVDPRLMKPIAGTADCAPSPPTSPTGSPTVRVCSQSTTPTVADMLKFDIAIRNRFVIAFFAASVYLVFLAKQRVDAAAKAEDRAASDEDKLYKSALDKLKKPSAAVTRAAEAYRSAVRRFPPLAEGALDPHVTSAEKTHRDAVRVLMSATQKAEEQKPLVGIARMGDVERRIVRRLYFFSILSNMGAGICSAGSFFLSVELQMGDPTGFWTLMMFAVPGIPMIVSHLFSLFVALKED